MEEAYFFHRPIVVSQPIRPQQVNNAEEDFDGEEDREDKE